jgi:hypothetical protein
MNGPGDVLLLVGGFLRQVGDDQAFGMEECVEVLGFDDHGGRVHGFSLR